MPVLLVVQLHFAFQQKGRRRVFISTACFIAPVLVCLLAVWIRNAEALGHFSPVVMNPGTVFFEGNNPLSWGQDVVYPELVSEMNSEYPNQSDYQHELYRLIARKATNRPLSVPEVNSYWINKAKNFLLDNPGHALKLFSTKLFHCFHNYQWHDLSNAYWNEESIAKSKILTIPFALISSLALVGLLTLARDAKKIVLIYAVYFCQIVVMVFIYVHARHRIAIFPLFIFFACAGIQAIIQSKKRLLLTAGVIALFVLLYIPTDLMREETHLWQTTETYGRLISNAYRLRAAGKWKEASDAAARAIATCPWQLQLGRPSNLPISGKAFVLRALQLSKQPTDLSALFDRATLLLEAGKIKEAWKIFYDFTAEHRQFKRDQYQSSQPLFYIAIIAEARNDRAPAIRILEKALKDSPGDPDILSYLFALTGNSQYKEKLFRYFDELDAEFYLGKAYLETGNSTQAARNFESVVSKLPNFRRGLIYLAAALAESNQLEAAASAYRKAIGMRSDPVLLEDPMIELFRRIANAKSRDPFAQYSYGIVLRQFGHYEEALKVQQTAQILAPANRQIISEIETIKRISGS